MEDEGPAFLSFSGLPDENVYDFVNNVEALRKHFKWSSQVTYCYARTMLKGAARKTVQGAKAGEAKRADEAADPSSWSNLKSALVFEFSSQYTQDRAMVQLLATRQEAGESGSEYAQRFVNMVSALIVAHPLDSNLLAILFASGLRSEKARWELLLRRLNTIDKAVGYVAPDQLYKVTKLTALMSPLPLPAAVDSAGEMSPTSEASASFAVPSAASLAASSTFVDEADELSMREVYGAVEADGLDLSGLSLADCARGSTANGASFALDDSGDDAQAPWAAYDPQYAACEPLTPSGYWTPPRLPDARQRRQHRQSMSARATAHGSASISGMQVHGSASISGMQAHSSSNIPHEHLWTPTGRAYSTLPRPSSFAANRHGDDDSQSQTASDTDDQPRSATELNSLADQLESLSSMLRTQSDARRRRPRLCYRCRQKGHIAADCHLPPEKAVPKQPAPDRPNHAARASTISAASWRASGLAGSFVHSRSGSGSRPSTPSRRYTQSWGRNNPQTAG
ncbi:hypothetical protein GGF43_001223 [Coemansia sp. RSA 2618]|nr:hypothetical protein GGF43_001223 [Coemansia sp. RSA 2618]